jgi:iron-sulfur cluster repair protein YtfE (RIC family)
MEHTCDGRCGGGRTVGEIMREHPDAREALAAMGINHCCGAHLSLEEAAAAAGVSVEAVLAALERARTKAS